MWTKRIVAGALVGIPLSITSAAAVAAGPDGAHQSPLNRGDHSAVNRYFPLAPGTVTVFTGSDGADHFREVVTVTHQARVIQGKRARVVEDVLRRTDGSLAEKTDDYYATDHAGTVWYFGEDTATYDRQGRLISREGSWLAGRNGAHKGMVMTAHPRVGQAYRQEFLPGEAEDQAWTVQTDAVSRVPAGIYRHVLRSMEWTRLEPDVISQKLYAPGIGLIAERDLAGGEERFVLASVTHH